MTDLSQRPLRPATDTSLRDLRLKELATRVRWFIRLRWGWSLLCLLGAAVAAADLSPIRVDYRFPLAAAIFLVLTNLGYASLTRRYTAAGVKLRGIRLVIILQTFTDFLLLSILSYALGGMAPPVLALFLGEIIILTLLCECAVSFAMMLIGALFAALPILLEHAGWLQVPRILAGPFAETAALDAGFTAMYVGGILVFFIYCWYLVSTITRSLRLREQQLEETYKKLLQLDREKTQATVRATHELKAPLAAISSYVYTLRDGYCGELPPQAQRVVERIGARAEMLMKKTTGIIHLSNLRTLVAEEARLETVDLTAFLAKEVAEARVLGAGREVGIVNRSADAPAFVIRGSREQLHAMISNLLRNAINYSHRGGTVEVELRGAKDEVALSIRDHGIGIPPENRERIFEEHFRSNNAVAHNPNSTGLGLAIVRETVKLHDARLDLKSELGKGTEFTITFPIRSAPWQRS